ncbi:MAG: hypothetical protein JW384_02217 [Nitrosomonadaceae bacterium]|nr:hypothetical protein [Nitrosomonadaceae bacterium]
MSGCTKLGLGTVQWGMAYGIANSTGQPSGSEIGNMLRVAKQHGVMLLDTACTYGEAEARLGSQGATAQGFQIVTKVTPIKSSVIRDEDVGLVRLTFLDSLRLLQCKQVYGLLVHHAADLLQAGGERLWAALQDLKVQGHVGKIGVSVYNPAQLEKVLESYDIDLVQLPFNIYDQRFAQTGLLKQLKGNGVEVHARSAYLQGLLLLPAKNLPEHFHRIRNLQAQSHRNIREQGLVPREACLRFCLDHPHIDQVVVGVETLQQLVEIIDASKPGVGNLSWAESSAITDQQIINPSMWP